MPAAWPGSGRASLGARLVGILTITGLAGALAITLLLAAVITPSFHRLEAAGVDAQVQRTRMALVEFGGAVEEAARDYGDWTVAYDQAARPTPAFAQESVSATTLRGLDLQGMAYLAPDGHVIAARWLGAPALKGRFAESLRGLPIGRMLRGRSSRFGYLALDRTVLAVGVAQVRRSDGSGAPRGHVVMVRKLTATKLAELARIEGTLVPAIAGGVNVRATNRAWDEVRVAVDGIDGRPVAAVCVPMRRDVSLLGRRMLLLTVAGSTVLLLLMLLVLRRVISAKVLVPLRRIEAHMQRVRASGSLAPLADDGRKDEVGALGRSFNAMLGQLAQAREQIEAQSFALGRQDTAVAVMHNVRNALNPVSTILSQGLAQPAPVARERIDRALAELADESIPAVRRRKLAAFVAAGVEAWAAHRAAILADLTIGREALGQALEIIGAQQQRAHERPAVGACDVTELIARNATIARYSHLASIAFSFPSAPHPVLANRMILSQVIGNLFGNAAEAIAARGTGSGAIVVTVAQRGDLVEIRIRDDGEGFDAETGAALFGRGFSTRSHKSGGLGLHWCANAVTAMGGALRLESLGPGQGATAILTLQAAAEVRIAA